MSSLDLFDSLLTMGEIMLAIPPSAEKLVQLSVMHLMDVARAAKHEKCFVEHHWQGHWASLRQNIGDHC